MTTACDPCSSSGGLLSDPLEPSLDEDPLLLIETQAANGEETCGEEGDDSRHPSKPTPDAPYWWARPLLALGLNHKQLANLKLLDQMELVYASDASGADAPLCALKALRAELWEALGVDLRIRHAFGSEAPGPDGNVGRSFLLLNHKPEVLFTDMCARKHTGHDFITNMAVPTPRVHIYVAGWVCVDLCTFNRAAKPLDIKVTEDSGATSKTLEASMFYVKTFRPAVAILENLYRVNTVQTVLGELRKIDGFAVEAFVSNAQDFGMLTSRNRLFIVAVDLKQCSLRTPISEWVSTLNSCARALPRFTLADFNDEGAESLVEQQYAQPLVESELHDVHFAVRATLRLKHNLDVPAPAEMAAGPHGSPGQAIWLPSREQDTINFHQWILREVMGIDPTEHDFLWDITNSIEYFFPKSMTKAGVCPCFLTTHKIWSTKAQALITGMQKMRIMGFPKTIEHEGTVTYAGAQHHVKLTDHSFHHLAGNTIAIPIIGALLAVCLAEVSFAGPAGPPGPKDNVPSQAFIVGAMSQPAQSDCKPGTGDAAKYGFDAVVAGPYYKQVQVKRQRTTLAEGK